MILFVFEVVSGRSSGAVVFETPEGSVLAGVVVARQNSSGYAFAVAVNGWLREKLSRALTSTAATE
ncbi:MAG: hypothetical protein AAF999_15015 [Pseudomonadota bacterium]